MRPSLPILLLTLLLMPASLAASAESRNDEQVDLGPPMALHDARRGTLLFRTTEPGAFLPAPTLDTRVTIGVTGLVARASVAQVFHNPTADWLEGVYVFPLPENAAVDHLRMIVGERVIVGEIREREEAKRVYEQAKNEGKKASLVSQERPNVFTTAVANIGPGEDVEIVIEYQEDLRYDSGRFHLRFPLAVAPRYIPGTEPVTGSSGSGWGINTRQVPDAERITPPVPPPGSGVENPVTLEVRLDTGLPLARLESTSHPIVTEDDGAGRYRVTLANGTTPADRDFVLRPGDFFNVLRFSDSADRLFGESRPADPAYLAEARRFIRRLEADGGTEMLSALELALADQDAARCPTAAPR